MSDPITRLIEAGRADRKRILVVGDAMQDVYVHGEIVPCQDGCMRFDEHDSSEMHLTPGGAANAARQLYRWNADTMLLAITGRQMWRHPEVNTELCFDSGKMPIKTRYLVGDRIVFRRDREWTRYDIGSGEMEAIRGLTLMALRNMRPDAVLISDYDKGFMDDVLIEEIVGECRERGIVVVADAKRMPSVYHGAILKCNREYYEKYAPAPRADRLAGIVATEGAKSPMIWERDAEKRGTGDSAVDCRESPVICRNHVGAGDCFAAHLVLGLAHGLSLEDACVVAHAAGRVYVSHRHGRAPWTFEVARSGLGAAGKVLREEDALALGYSLGDRAVAFTNGVFRVPHAGHAWLMEWIKRDGGCKCTVVVGVNDAQSAARIRPNQYVLPLAQRMAMLAAIEAVDWVIPFSGDTPEAIMAQLQPEVLVKGDEYRNQAIPGSQLAGTTMFAPPGPFRQHSSDILKDYDDPVGQTREEGAWKNSGH